jgi:hypothetical protein
MLLPLQKMKRVMKLHELPKKMKLMNQQLAETGKENTDQQI